MNPLTLLRHGLNRLLPFATPGTPILQDLLHLAALCTLLYYAPVIQTFAQQRLGGESSAEPGEQTDEAQQGATQDDPADVDPRPAAQPGPDQAANDAQGARWEPAHVDDDDDDDNDSDDDNDGGGGGGGGGPAEGEAGPAGGGRPRPAANRTVGAKKAKSLARRDQRRAYHEFMRSQGEAQRARDAQEAREREAVVAGERARRAAAEAELEARRAGEREARRAREARERREEMERRAAAVEVVRAQLASSSGLCDLAGVARRVGGGVDREWVERLVRASGIFNEAQRDGALVTITESGWVVRVTRGDLDEAYRIAVETAQGGNDADRVTPKQLGGILEHVIRRKPGRLT
ncbi:hypothetical protein MBLNU459_g3731t1 [Dothideomycetes sp. NU459]